MHSHSVENITDSQSSGTREEKRLCINSYVCFNGKYRFIYHSKLVLYASSYHGKFHWEGLAFETILSDIVPPPIVSMAIAEHWMKINWRRSLEISITLVIISQII